MRLRARTSDELSPSARSRKARPPANSIGASLGNRPATRRSANLARRRALVQQVASTLPTDRAVLHESRLQLGIRLVPAPNPHLIATVALRSSPQCLRRQHWLPYPLPPTGCSSPTLSQWSNRRETPLRPGYNQAASLLTLHLSNRGLLQ